VSSCSANSHSSGNPYVFPLSSSVCTCWLQRSECGHCANRFQQYMHEH
jgi:hypothetical protein